MQGHSSLPAEGVLVSFTASTVVVAVVSTKVLGEDVLPPIVKVPAAEFAEYTVEIVA